jgi:hypothetical protein
VERQKVRRNDFPNVDLSDVLNWSVESAIEGACYTWLLHRTPSEHIHEYVRDANDSLGSDGWSEAFFVPGLGIDFSKLEMDYLGWVQGHLEGEW